MQVLLLSPPELPNSEDLDAVVQVMLQLRPSYSAVALKAQIERQLQMGYHLAYVKENSDVLAVAGYVLGEKLAWGKYIYIDDLVTSEKQRSRGAGKCLLDWFKAHATEHGIQQIHLDSGVQRFAAHKFYLREGFAIASHHFSLHVDSSS